MNKIGAFFFSFFSFFSIFSAIESRASTMVYSNSTQGLTVSGFVANVTGIPISSDLATANVTISASDGTNNCTLYTGSLSNIPITNGDFNLVLSSGTLSGTYTTLSQILDSSNAAIIATSCTAGASPINGTLASWQVNIYNLIGAATYIGATPLIIPITGVPFAQVSRVAISTHSLEGSPLDLLTTTPVAGNVLGYNGSRWVPSSVMSGSGTANYLAKYTGGSNLASSVMYDNGTNLGIGTTSPGYPLEVDSAATAIYGATTSAAQYAAGVNGNSSSFSAGVYGNSVYGSGVIAMTSDSSSASPAMLATHAGPGPGLQAGSTTGNSGFFQSVSSANTSATVVIKRFGASSADLFQAQNSAGTPVLKISSIGYVGIAMSTPPSTPLQVAGEISPSTDNAYTLGDATHRFTSVYATNGTIQTSDAREKKNIKTSDLGLAFINRLNPVSYLWKSGEDKVLHYGLIAQDTALAVSQAKGTSGKTIPIVDHDLKSDRYGIRYTELIAPLIKSVQEISAQLLDFSNQSDQRSQEFSTLKAEYALMAAKADQSEKALAELKAYVCAKDANAALCSK